MNEFNYKGTGQGTNASDLVKLGRFFYIINPYEHNYGFVKEVPDYVVDVSMLSFKDLFLFMQSVCINKLSVGSKVSIGP